MWLAVAAMAVVSLARVQTGTENAPASTNPVLHFLAGYQGGAPSAATGAPYILHLGSARKASVVFLHDAAPGTWIAVLPVLFVGLVAPLSLISPRSILSLGCAPSASGLPASFQRPPPAFL